MCIRTPSPTPGVSPSALVSLASADAPDIQTAFPAAITRATVELNFDFDGSRQSFSGSTTTQASAGPG